jgi:hypothetical protein
MKRLFTILALASCCVLPLAAQTKTLNSMSLNGVTGLYVVPTARAGWGTTDMGFNAGYHMNFVNKELEDIFQANISLFKWVEIAASYVGQYNDHDDDLLLGLKIALPVKGTAIAFGGNFHYGDMGRNFGSHFATQVYGVVSYTATFFGMPADTSLVIGKSFFEDAKTDSSIDFGMGFDLIVLPKQLRGFVHWIVDFSNYGYNQGGVVNIFGGALPNQANTRGMVNTGLRFDLSRIPALGKFNFVIDAYITDAFDDATRYFGIGAVFGAAL